MQASCLVNTEATLWTCDGRDSFCTPCPALRSLTSAMPFSSPSILSSDVSFLRSSLLPTCFTPLPYVHLFQSHTGITRRQKDADGGEDGHRTSSTSQQTPAAGIRASRNGALWGLAQCEVVELLFLSKFQNPGTPRRNLYPAPEPATTPNTHPSIPSTPQPPSSQRLETVTKY